MLNEIQKYSPEIFSACHQAFSKVKILKRVNKKLFIIDQTFANCPYDSIDYALLEKSIHKMLFKINFDWLDIGSWNALYELKPKDKCGNTLHGKVIVVDCQNTQIINNDPHRLIALVGTKSLTVVNSGNAMIILPRIHSQKVKQIVEEIKKQQMHDFLNY